MATPQGFANADYSRPCPGCTRPIVKGDNVIKVALLQKSAWWHIGCRTEYVAVLLMDNELTAPRD